MSQKLNFAVRHVTSVPINYDTSRIVVKTDNKVDIIKMLRDAKHNGKFFLITILRGNLPVNVCNRDNFVSELAKLSKAN